MANLQIASAQVLPERFKISFGKSFDVLHFESFGDFTSTRILDENLDGVGGRRPPPHPDFHPKSLQRSPLQKLVFNFGGVGGRRPPTPPKLNISLDVGTLVGLAKWLTTGWAWRPSSTTSSEKSFSSTSCLFTAEGLGLKPPVRKVRPTSGDRNGEPAWALASTAARKSQRRTEQGEQTD